jgi:D-glycero-D-manno-heptose 1,7-bisphosphate phosphatase
MKPAIFLDRDGTINEEMGYINHPDRFKIFSFVANSIKIFNRLGFKVIVVTNQSGIARGYFDERLLKVLHEHLRTYLIENSAQIDAIYYCPHHPTEGIEKYKLDCSCRKPKPGMIEQATREFDINLSKSYLIGDTYKDIAFAKSLNIKTGLVMTGYGKGEYKYRQKYSQYQPDMVGENLHDIATQIEQICDL